ncbi:probable inorganic phosphate transporter 1-9 [Juglans microcarpa x Juglans regia]|uniref:probable inorganic phosphate transporter 1-9 n=1 Tax=Juglans microcarpa x Juglans regia TaxID=2249226 RepID=UPI001B7DAAD2|nr:probable inorganic phosphate transporter 1-9 [Juglans microcarpa x Juglans regia]
MALKVLSALDSAKTQLYHFKAIIIAGMGLFTDAYDLFCIPPIMILIGRVYYDKEVDKYRVPPGVVSTMVAIALLGTAIGQVVFGRLGDQIGRRRVYGTALLIMVVSSLACGFSICRKRGCVLASLGLFRFALGLGIGGDYPLSAVIMSEFANKTTRGAFIAAVFSMQGFGILAASTVTMVVCAIFDRLSKVSPSAATPDEADIAWRLILMLGAIPAALTFYWRMMMPETARYTALVAQNVPQAARDVQKVLEVPMSEITEENPVPLNPPTYPLFSKQFFHRHGRDLLACSCTWFLLDIVFYSSNLFQSQIYEHYLPNRDKVNAYKDAFAVAKFQAIVAACSTIPGYWFTVYFIDVVGRVRIQAIGFLCMALVYLAIGIPYEIHWKNNTNAGFMVLYGLTFFFANFGPNTTTFIVPAELFPAKFRTTCHGISGAAGKVGAIIGSVGFLWASHKDEKSYPDAIGMTASLILLAGVCLAGMVVTLLFTRETMGRSLEENENDQDGPGELRLGSRYSSWNEAGAA